jgi:hypothetical protein
MTTIAVDKFSIACDLQFSHQNGMKFKGKSKCLELTKENSEALFTVKKAIIGACGDADEMGEAWGFLSNPMLFDGKFPKFKRTEFVALCDGGTILTSVNLRNWIVIEQPYYSIGSGSHFAMGALTTGKSPREAVKIASKHDALTGMGVKEYKLVKG